MRALLAALSVLFALCLVPFRCGAATDGFASLLLADSIYVEQVPILLLIRYMNTGPTEKEIQVDLNLKNLDTGKIEGMRRMHFHEKPGEMRVGPGEIGFKVVNLPLRFGQHDQKRWPLSERIGEGTLPRGSYELAGVCRSGNEEVGLAPLRFQVRSLEEIPQEGVLAHAFQDDCISRSTADEFRACSERWIDRFIGKPWFAYVFFTSGFRTGRSVPALLRTMKDAGNNPTLRAAVLWILLTVDRGSPSERKVMLKQLIENDPTPLEREVMTTWATRKGLGVGK